MIPNIQPTRFESNVSSIQHAFTIEMTPTLAKLLSSQTYTDKILAAIREPLSNAYDSHVRAGTLDVPAKLHLPTPLEPHFSLRDYGTGLSHDDVIRLFFSYGVSDKRGTNNEIGGLGIGAKAFFAYTDQAVITSWFNGQKRTYSANKGTNGLPQGMLVSIEETDEPNGIELSYPVGPGENYDFESKAVQVLTHLKLNFTCNKSLTINKPNIVYSLSVNNNQVDILSGTDTHAVVMGGIAYAVPADIWVHKCRETYDFIMRESFILHLPIGSVEISASRESLSPTEQDKAFIAELLFQTREILKATDWDTTIATATSWVEAVKMRSNLGGFMDFQEYVVDGKKVPAEEVMKWRGYRTRGNFTLPDGSHPVTLVERKGRRGNVYTSSFASSYRVDYPIVAAYWMPANKRIGWKDWYKNNVDLNYHSNNRHLHFATNTMAEAEALAAVYGYDGPILDGSKCRVARPKRPAANASPRPKGIVLNWDSWESTKIKFEDLDPEYVIYSADPENKDRENLHWLDSLRNISLFIGGKHNPVIISRFGMTENRANKLFKDLPKSVDEWIQKNPDKINWAVFETEAVNALIEEEWDENWVRFGVMQKYEKIFGFPVTLSCRRIPSNQLSRIKKLPSVKKQLGAIQRWHATKFLRLPPTLQATLRRNSYYGDVQQMIKLYEEMK